MSNASDSNLKPLVVVVGGTGITGLSILKGLAKAGEWVRLTIPDLVYFPSSLM